MPERRCAARSLSKVTPGNAASPLVERAVDYHYEGRGEAPGSVVPLGNALVPLACHFSSAWRIDDNRIACDETNGGVRVGMMGGRAMRFAVEDGELVFGPGGTCRVPLAADQPGDPYDALGLPPRSVAFQVLLDPIIAYTQDQIVAAEAVSGQVLAKEDFAFVVDSSVAAGDLVALVRRAGGALVEDARVFDVYAGAQVGEGLKSVAVNVRMRAADHTLTAEEVLDVRKAVIGAAESELGATLR